MEANYVHKDSTTLIQDELVKNELNQIELQYNALKQQKFNELLKENQELKEQLEEYKKKLMIATKMEIKQIDETTFLGIDYFQDKCINYETQQKEFIKYLEDMLDDENDIFSVVRVKDVLQKYKEIIGVLDEKK